MINATSFMVSATLSGPTISDAAIGSGGKIRVFFKDAWNTVIANNPWNKTDIEVRDLTVDGNWTGFGTVLTTNFTVPAEGSLVTIAVQSSTWAITNKRVYIQQADYTPVGVYEMVDIPDSTHLTLRNAPGFGNLSPGSVVPAGTKVCPRIKAHGVGLSAQRCKIERVRVTNVGTAIYEGVCGIEVVCVDLPAVSEVVIRDCVVDGIWGQYGTGIAIDGNNLNSPLTNTNRFFGIQGLVEGNTIYGNGQYQGFGGGNAINSFWINNKTVGCGDGSFFVDTGFCWNNVIKDNVFLQCKAWPVILGGGPPVWSSQTSYHVGDIVFWSNVIYTATADNSNQQPPITNFWQVTQSPAASAYDRYVFEGNLFEVCDNCGPLLFNGDVANTVFRNNILRYAPGCGHGSYGLNFSKASNRGLIVTGNMIDSRLTNQVGNSIVFGRDNIDEMGHLRTELESP